MSHDKTNSLRSILFALGANGSIFVAKLTAALITGSGAMLAEAVHSLADTGNQFLLILGLKQSKKKPTAEHPLGYGKSIYFWSFIVAVMMFSMGGMFSVYEGVHKLLHPEPMTNGVLAVAVLGFSIAAESVSMWGCLREVNKVRRGRNIFRWFRESRRSELMVIFGEDFAALLGLSFALCAVLLTMFTGNPVYDAIGTIVIGALLIGIAFMIGVEVKCLIIGQSVAPYVKEELEEFLAGQNSIDSVLNLITLQLGEDVMVAVKARMIDHAGQQELIQSINDVETAMRKQFPQVVWIFFEPDCKD